MSRARRNLHSKRLRTQLALADDEHFIQLVWATDAIQSGREQHVGRGFDHPREAVTTEMTSDYMVQKWELETLVNQLLATPKAPAKLGRISHFLRCDRFGTMRSLTNALRSLEDAEAAMYLDQTNVMAEMHRIAHRTFPWQVGIFNQPRLYRSAFLYGQGRAAEHFRQVSGMEAIRFMMVGFYLHAGLATYESLPRRFPDLKFPSDLTAEEWDSGIKLIARPIEESRREASRLLGSVDAFNPKSLTAFRASVLRSRPIIAFGHRQDVLRAPLPVLIIDRTTAGIYYDLVGGPSDIRNDVAARFETYTKELIESFLPGLELAPSYKFRIRGKEADSCDVRVKRDGELLIAVECKTTKLTLGAQFSDDPFVDERQRYDEMVKAIVQVWKFFSNARRGLANEDTIAADATGLVVTLESWLILAGPLQVSVYEEAERRADKDSDILEEDRRPVTFTGITDLEWTLARLDEDAFVEVVRKGGEPEFRGWMLGGLAGHLGIKASEPKDYRFDPADLLPWLGEIKDRRKIRQAGP